MTPTGARSARGRRRRWTAWVWAGWLAWGLARPWEAPARDIFVSNVLGDDTSTGDAPTMMITRGPVRTIAKALRLAQPSDRIVLANTGEPYRESISLLGTRLSGTAEDPFTIEGNGATLEGARAATMREWEFVGGQLFRIRPARLGYQQLFLAGRPATRRAITSPVGALPALAPLEWCLAGDAILFAAEPGRVPDYYEPSIADLPTGVMLYQVRHVLVQNLVVQGFQLDGVNAHDGAIEVVLRGLTLRGNGRSGARVAGSSRATLVDSLAGDNGAAQALVEGFSHAYFVDCELLANTAPPLVQRGGEVWLDGKRPPERANREAATTWAAGDAAVSW